jgi:hypothetical protein
MVLLCAALPACLSAAPLERGRAVLEEHAVPHGALPAEHETHAATITEAADGTLVAAWFGGTEENHPDVAVWASRKPPGAAAWSEAVVVDDGSREVGGERRDFSCWNPVLFTGPGDGTVYLYYKITGDGSEPGYKNWWGAVRTSRDAGATWSERVWLPMVPDTSGARRVFEPYSGHATGPVKNRPLAMPDGSLLCASSTESPVGWRVHFERYQAGDWTGEKHGVEIVGPLPGGLEGIQPTFLVHSPDHQKLQVLTREDGTAWSEDGGRSWSELVRGPVDTSKGLHAVTASNGWHFLAFNPTGRTPLSLARSRDGREWETVLPVLHAEGALKMDYPTVMQSADGKLHVVHSFGRDHINHLVLDTDYLSGPAGGGTAPAGGPDTDGFTALFPADGPPAGWVVRAWNDVSKPADGDPQWNVTDGILTSSQVRGNWLMSEKEFGDFTLEYEFKLGPLGNSGCALRSPMAGDPAFDGLELQMADFRYNTSAKPSELTAGFYRAAAPTEQAYRPEVWNTMQVTLQGSQATVVLNGKTVQDIDLSDFTESVKRHDGTDAPPLAQRPRRGHIGFQNLSRGDEPALIRKARIKELP